MLTIDRGLLAWYRDTWREIRLVLAKWVQP
jgi:hypothetical protein